MVEAGQMDSISGHGDFIQNIANGQQAGTRHHVALRANPGEIAVQPVVDIPWNDCQRLAVGGGKGGEIRGQIITEIVEFRMAFPQAAVQFAKLLTITHAPDGAGR